MVRRTGGLKDTVTDISEKNGFGICFNNATLTDIDISIQRGLQLFEDNKKMAAVKKLMMEKDHSWPASAKKYLDLYQSV